MAPDQKLQIVDPNTPSPARAYDYLLGGHHNHAADRAAAEAFIARNPELRRHARANRGFAARAVDYLAGQGIDQFLDVGSGLPTAENVHQIAQRLNPAARVQYVDNDPNVLAYGRGLLEDNHLSSYAQADARDPDTV